ncbi:MAG: hypothetical protein HWD82_02635 [Flavobacteriaceae bacterium]|nr:hypothetical protein [Flavobacteriaceae bacterium]
MAVAVTGDELETIEQTMDKDSLHMYLKVIKWREIVDNKDTLVNGMIKEFLNENEVKKLLNSLKK